LTSFSDARELHAYRCRGLPIGADEERGGAEEEVSGDRLQGSLRI